MGDRDYRSIGETLDLIKDEFPEVTISKIRFLETQGLIAPERTTNGYRKFYDHDIEKLAFVLRQQREQFLPLKVIKDRITEKEPGVFILDPDKGRFSKAHRAKASKFEQDIFGDPFLGPPSSSPPTKSNPKAESKHESPPSSESARPAASMQAKARYGRPQASRTDSRIAAPADIEVADSRSGSNKGHQSRREEQQALSRQGSMDTQRAGGARRPRLFALPSNSSLAESIEDTGAVHESGSEAPYSEDAGTDGSEVNYPKNSFTARDIAEQADMSLVQVQDLITYGLLSPTSVRGQQIFSGADLELASLAKEFARFGLEARHLKMYKVSAEREASFLEQVILPILANKSQKSRSRAENALTQLGEIGAQFRTLLLERAIEKILKS